MTIKFPNPNRSLRNLRQPVLFNIQIKINIYKKTKYLRYYNHGGTRVITGDNVRFSHEKRIDNHEKSNLSNKLI